MGKVILEFDSFEEQEDMAQAMNGGKYLAALQEFDNYLRGRLKYEELSQEVDAALQAARDKLHEEMNSMGVSLWS